MAVIDFETTGLSPAQGDRATEIAVVILRDGEVVERYQSLMNAGVRIPSYIQELTGISDAMIRAAPPVAEVMREAAAFVGDTPLLDLDQQTFPEIARSDSRRVETLDYLQNLRRRLFAYSEDGSRLGQRAARRGQRALATLPGPGGQGQQRRLQR